MTRIFDALVARARTERGATLVEYALMVALVAVVAIVAITFVGESSSMKFNTTRDAIQYEGEPGSSYNLAGSCDTVSCTFADPDYDPNIRYTWQMPDGTIVTGRQPTFSTVGYDGDSMLVYAHRDNEVTGDEDWRRIRCDRSGDSFRCR